MSTKFLDRAAQEPSRFLLRNLQRLSHLSSHHAFGGTLHDLTLLLGQVHSNSYLETPASYLSLPPNLDGTR